VYDVIVRGGTVVASGRAVAADVGVRDGRITAVAVPETLGTDGRIIDARGKHVLPGLVDAHVHLRDPGFTHKEDTASGTRAAAAGGVTTVMAIPNTAPPLVTAEAFRGAARLAAETAVVDVALFAGARMGDPARVDEFTGADTVGYDLYDDPYAFGTSAWIELFSRVRAARLPLAFYLTDTALQRHVGRMLSDRGAAAVDRFADTTNSATEIAAIARIVPFAAQFEVPVVLRAVTTPGALAYIRHIRGAVPDARVTVEMCVPHLFLTREALADMGNRAVLQPPPRPRADLDALWEAARDGTVDYLATDHAPHAPREKADAVPFDGPPGIVGLETALPLLLTACAAGRLAVCDLVRLCCEQPARTYGLFPQKGAIAAGADADLVLVDLNERWRIDAGRFYSRGDRGPFDGWDVTGRPWLTMVRGRPVMSGGAVDVAPWGRLVAARPRGTPPE
jgi:dihydroorotase